MLEIYEKIWHYLKFQTFLVLKRSHVLGMARCSCERLRLRIYHVEFSFLLLSRPNHEAGVGDPETISLCILGFGDQNSPKP